MKLLTENQTRKLNKAVEEACIKAGFIHGPHCRYFQKYLNHSPSNVVAIVGKISSLNSQNYFVGISSNDSNVEVYKCELDMAPGDVVKEVTKFVADPVAYLKNRIDLLTND